jgi:hypothetical protein
MMVYPKWLISFLLVCVTIKTFSQSTIYQSHQPIPPSPEAAKLAQFELNPPSAYTGANSISIPVYKIEAKGSIIPISIQYHGSGIRVSENASWVGLGWSLNTGGSITRTVQGLNDLQNGNGFLGYCIDPMPIPDSLTNWTGFDWLDPYWHSYLRGYVDTEPDIFSYSFLNTSGEFILSKKSQTGGVIIPIKTKINADKVEYDESQNNFTVTTAEGVKGIFSVKEYTMTISGSNNNGNWTACGGQFVDISQTLNQGGRAVTSWYLSEIVFPSEEVIHYSYQVNSNGNSEFLSLSSPSWGEIRSINAVTTAFPEELSTQHCSRILTEHVYPTQIASSDFGFQIDFTLVDREDIEKLSDSALPYSEWRNAILGHRGETFSVARKPQRLHSISIQNTLSNSSINFTANLHHSYFGGTPLGNYDVLRLRLDSVKIFDQSYSFGYLDGLPNKSTLGVDYWGYYNGMDSNLSITPVALNMPPSLLYAGVYFPQTYYYQTPARKANFNFGKAGLLTKITYPTGGYTEYTYEPHDYKLVGQEHIPIVGNSGFSASGLISDQTISFNYKGFGFDDCQGPITLTMSTQCKDFFLGNTCTIAPADVNTMAVELLKPNGSQKASLTYQFQWALNMPSQYSTQQTYNPLPTTVTFAEAGVYTLKAYGVRVNGVTKYYGDINISVPNSCLTQNTSSIVTREYNQTSGGARIKNITMFDSNGEQLLKRSYSYSSPDQGGVFSSGSLMNPLMHMSKQNGGSPYWIYTSGSSINHGSAAQGSHIGYSYVRETILGKNGEDLGKTDYYFSNIPNQISPWAMSNQAALANTSFKLTNGMMERQSVFSTQALQTTEYTNQLYQGGDINALKVNWIYVEGVRNPSMHSFYKIPIGAGRVVGTSETIYANGTSNVVKKLMQYNALNQVIKVSRTHADGLIIDETETKYPIDFLSPSSIIQTMKTKNIMSPIESVFKRKGLVVSAEGIKYKIENNRVLMDKYYRFNRDKGAHVFSTDGSVFAGGYEEVESVTQYDDQGNMLEKLDRGGIYKSYIWGYGRNYVVAQLVGIRRAQVDALLGLGFNTGTGGLSGNQLLQLRTSFPLAQITTYEYDPGAGIKAFKDTNDKLSLFTYDSMGRLKKVLDHNNNIVKRVTYHYKTPDGQ